MTEDRTVRDSGSPLSSPDVDFAMLGEGEFPAQTLMRAPRRATNSAGRVAFIKDGKWSGTRKNYVEDLDSLPSHARHLLAMTIPRHQHAFSFTTRRTPFTPMITSRGCRRVHLLPGPRGLGSSGGRARENVHRGIDSWSEYGIPRDHSTTTTSPSTARAMKSSR